MQASLQVASSDLAQHLAAESSELAQHLAAKSSELAQHLASAEIADLAQHLAAAGHVCSSLLPSQRMLLQHQLVEHVLQAPSMVQVSWS